MEFAGEKTRECFSVHADSAPEPFLFTVARLVGEQALFRAARPFPFLAADFFNPSAFGIQASFLKGFDFVQQKAAGQETVEALLSRGLAFDLQAGRTVEQHHARGRLVDVLAAVPARPDKRFFDVGFAHA
ncbi:MAG TPA: hypothetical protein VE988_09185 [Gemmataceae bacterium]|nr:hypothetical protein [Gemmataceae bacterium]